MAQTEPVIPSIPAMRQLHHEYIIESLKKIDSFYKLSDSSRPNAKYWVDSTITRIRYSIENNNAIDVNGKYRWLRSVNDLLTSFISANRSKRITLNNLPLLINSYDEAMKLDLQGASVYPVFEKNRLPICYILVDNYGFKENFGIAKAKDLIVWKYCQLHPENILPALSDHPANIFADSLIVQAAFLDPEKLYNYAAAPNALGRKIQSGNHPLVQLIGQLSATKTGRMYFPFLDKLYNNTINIDSITPLLTEEHAEGYYKLLVATRMEYAQRMQQADTPMLVKVLTAKLQTKAIELYINDINALHELKDLKQRFKKLNKLNATELYYLAVMGETEMYTSSFVSGIYPRIFQSTPQISADSLLRLVHDDYFKKFIRIAATYNTLDDFLKRMDSSAAVSRMRNFVSGVEKGRTLEDAVDVADSYASIYQPALRLLILQEVQKNLQQNVAQHNQRGVRMYQLMQDIFLSLDTSNHIDISEKLGIPPVYILPNLLLQDSCGRIIMQQFFYGDKDGANIFAAFINGFQNGKWNIVYKPEWVEISSRKGVQITIYANRPLNTEQDLDDKAQNDLIQYLEQQHLSPTIVIHRGHSYHLKSTIEKLAESAKLVILGGCGGYQNLNEVLQICPQAHIISTKQVGTGVINKGLINEISEKLRMAQDLNWPELWNDMAKQFRYNLKETFEDYVPPHKNLGAIFIMAYNKATEEKIL